MFTVISNPQFDPKAGFTASQFRKLDELYCKAASAKILNYRTVECDFDEGVASYTYYQTEHQKPLLQFVIRKVGPRTLMYEVFKIGKGGVAKSGVFDSAFNVLKQEIETFSNV